jgi:hypothetical protein
VSRAERDAARENKRAAQMMTIVAQWLTEHPGLPAVDWTTVARHREVRADLDEQRARDMVGVPVREIVEAYAAALGGQVEVRDGLLYTEGRIGAEPQQWMSLVVCGDPDSEFRDWVRARPLPVSVRDRVK